MGLDGGWRVQVINEKKPQPPTCLIKVLAAVSCQRIYVPGTLLEWWTALSKGNSLPGYIMVVVESLKFSPACWKNAASSFIWMTPVCWHSEGASTEGLQQNAVSSSEEAEPDSNFAGPQHNVFWQWNTCELTFLVYGFGGWTLYFWCLPEDCCDERKTIAAMRTVQTCKIRSQAITNHCAVSWLLFSLQNHESITQTGLPLISISMCYTHLKQHTSGNTALCICFKYTPVYGLNTLRQLKPPDSDPSVSDPSRPVHGRTAILQHWTFSFCHFDAKTKKKG